MDGSPLCWGCRYPRLYSSALLSQGGQLEGEGLGRAPPYRWSFSSHFPYRKWNLLVGVLHPASKTLPKPQLSLQAASSPAFRLGSRALYCGLVARSAWWSSPPPSAPRGATKQLASPLHVQDPALRQLISGLGSAWRRCYGTGDPEDVPGAVKEKSQAKALR